MVTFKNKETGRIKELPDRYAEGILLTAEESRGYVLQKEKPKSTETPSAEEPSKLIAIRKGGKVYKDLIKLATEKKITMKEIDETYSIGANVRKELEVLLK